MDLVEVTLMVILSLMFQIYLEVLEEGNKEEEEEVDFKALVDLAIKALIQMFFKCFSDQVQVTTSISVGDKAKGKRSREVDSEEVTVIFSTCDLIILDFIHLVMSVFFNNKNN